MHDSDPSHASRVTAFAQPAANEPLPRKGRVFHLAAAVDAYETRLSKLMENWFDATSCAEADAAVGEVRAQGVGLPELSVLALELCVAHAEVLALLWNRGMANAGTPAASAIEHALAHRRKASAALKGACLQALRTADS